MSILDALSESITKQASKANRHVSRITMPDGLLSIHDAVFECTLYRLGIDSDTIIELLQEPLEKREYYLKYCETHHKSML
jgi:hypothetical protein